MKIAILIAVIFLFFVYRSAGQMNSNVINVNVAEAAELIKNTDIIVLDVRTHPEAKYGKIKGAKVIDVKSSNFVNQIEKLDKSKTYLVYCRSGVRSVRACNIMTKQGFENLNNLKGGYKAWSSQ